jgi:hypothetical protein
LGYGTQGRQIDFGINLGGLGQLMPEDLADLGQRGPAPEHLSGQGMSEQVRSFAPRLEAGSLERPPDNVANGDRGGKTHVRRLHADEHPARATRGAVFL